MAKSAEASVEILSMSVQDDTGSTAGVFYSAESTLPHFLLRAETVQVVIRAE